MPELPKDFLDGKSSRSSNPWDWETQDVALAVRASVGVPPGLQEIEEASGELDSDD